MRTKGVKGRKHLGVRTSGLLLVLSTSFFTYVGFVLYRSFALALWSPWFPRSSASAILLASATRTSHAVQTAPATIYGSSPHASSASASMHGPATAGELLRRYHPVDAYTAPGTEYSVVLATTWFGGDMPFFRGTKANKCHASGCVATLINKAWAARSDFADAHLVLWHMGSPDYKGEDSIPAPGRDGRQLLGMMAGETFALAQQSPSLFTRFHTELSFRPSSIMRDSYVPKFVNDWDTQGITNPQKPISLDARVWQDIWETPLPWEDRTQDVLASWSSHYCRGSQSNREDLVRALLKAGLNISIFGAESNCLRNAPDDLLAADFSVQFKEMRRHPFHLAFENARVTGYVTEKFYWALLRGQVPVVYGAPDIARYAPGPDSYIDASEYVDKPEELIKLLKRVAADRSLYNTYHRWRTERSWREYGEVLRFEILEMIWVANATLDPQQWFQCATCHALRRHELQAGFEKASPVGIRPIALDMQPAFGANRKPESR